jgi:predicted GNAT family acetyltransferase
VTTEVRDNPALLRYELLVDGEVTGFVQYNMRDGRMVLVHTEVDEEDEGKGLAGILVAGTLDDVRRRGLRIVPVCPYVERYIERHPEYDDLVDHELFDVMKAEKDENS